MSAFIEICEQAARLGGKTLWQFQGKAAVQTKAPRDLVTEADLASQEVIFQTLCAAFPTHKIVGEEQLLHEPSQTGSPYLWLIDPLDGTTNYVHGLPYYGTSVALLENGDPIAGTVFNPVTNECFTAARGEGAYLNGKPLRVSEVTQLNQALMATSFAAQVAADSPEVHRFISVLQHAQAVRRMGSAALNLCYVAAGRLDGYFGSTTKAWDVAAGLLLVREAGGHISGIDGQPFDIEDPHFIAAANESLRSQIQQAI